MVAPGAPRPRARTCSGQRRASAWAIGRRQTPSKTTPTEGPVLVFDFGAQYVQLIARRVREAHVYSEIVPHTATAAELAAHRPAGIILSGGPKSVNETPAPVVDPDVYDLGVPVLGICYGAQLLTRQLGGVVDRTGRGEYGRTPLTVTATSPLFADWPGACEVWMSHADAITVVPARLFVTTTTGQTHAGRRLARPGAQHLRRPIPPRSVIRDTEHGRDLLERFLYDVCSTARRRGDPHSDHRESGGGRPGPGSRTSPVLCAVGAASTRPWLRRWCTRRSVNS